MAAQFQELACYEIQNLSLKLNKVWVFRFMFCLMILYKKTCKAQSGNRESSFIPALKKIGYCFIFCLTQLVYCEFLWKSAGLFCMWSCTTIMYIWPCWSWNREGVFRETTKTKHSEKWSDYNLLELKTHQYFTVCFRILLLWTFTIPLSLLLC